MTIDLETARLKILMQQFEANKPLEFDFTGVTPDAPSADTDAEQTHQRQYKGHLMRKR